MNRTFPDRAEILELYHIARASAGSARYDRMIYAQKWLKEHYPTASPKQLWLAIEAAIS
jgi:hypothetical protein